MDNNNDISRLSRLSAILTMLQSKRLLTASEIANKFNISKRTAYRDIKALEQSGIPITTEEGKGYSIMEGFTLPPVMFTEQEANALITAEKLIAKNKDQSLIRNHKNAVDKVKAVLKYSGKDKVELLAERIVYMKNFSYDTTSNCLSTTQIAITSFSVLKIKYKSISKNEISYRTLEPLALYHTQENWILIAWCCLKNAYREFRLDRILTLEILNEQFEPREFNLLEYFKAVQNKK